ncbi:MAG: hypothetical protein ABW252_17745 [Polyangiales bacterium]
MRTKTRLWSGGLADIVREAKERLPDSAFLQEAAPLPPPPVEGEEAASDSQVAEVAPPRLLPPRAALGGTTLVGHAFDLSGVREGAAWAPGGKGAELRATRLVPIESLLPSPAVEVAQEPASSEEERVDESAPSDAPVRRRVRLSGALVRRALMGVLGLAALVLFALPKPRPVPALPAPVVEAVKAPVAAAAPVAASVTAAGGAAVGGIVTPRQAVDALVSGDYVAAQRIYADLARETPEGEVYAEAARILSERVGARGD